jgi:hypothetical protein
VRSVPTPRLTFPLGPGHVVLRPDGAISAVVADSGSAGSYLDGGGRVAVRIDGVPVEWPDVSVAVDVDEVELHHIGRTDLDLQVRHSFTGGWTIRTTFLNQSLEPLSLQAELAWEPAADRPARALAAGATGAYAVPPADGTGPLLGGELVLGTCDAISAEGIGFGRFTLHPLERRVVQWRWDWFADARAFSARFPGVPSELVLATGEVAQIAANDDEAVVAPGGDLTRRGGHLEFSATVPQAVAVQVSSRRGVTEYEVEWVAPLDELLIEVGEILAAGPRSRTGLLQLADVDAAMVLQRLLAVGGAGDPDESDDALRLFSSRLEGYRFPDGRGVGFLCGEFERLGEEELLERATTALLALPDAVPGVGLATVQVCVARLLLGWPVEHLLVRLQALSAATDLGAEHGLDCAVSLELALVGGSRFADAVNPDEHQRLEAWSTRIGARLGAGLLGRPVRPLPVDQQAYLATVLGLLPESLAYRMQPEWGCRLHDAARRTEAEVLVELRGQRPRPAHSWLIMGARLA